MATVGNETHLVTIGNERHLRYVLLVGQGGTITLREILIRDLGPDFQKSIKEKKTNLKIERKEIERIFNSDDNDISDIKTWDISLLSKLILQLCREITPTDELKSVRDITRLRNQISHTSIFFKDEVTYFDECNDAAGILMNLCKGLDNSTKAMCQNLIKNCKKGQIEKQAALEVLAEIRKYDRIIVDQLESLRGKVEETLTDGGLDEEKVNIIQTGIEELKQTVKKYIRKRNAECQSSVALESKLTLRGSDVQLTELAEKTLVKMFRIENNRKKGEKDESKLMTEVGMLLDDIEGVKGVTYNGAYRQCVIMKLKCDNYKGLLEILDYFQSNEFRKRLGTLAKLLEEADGSHYQITFEIDRENVRSIKNKMEQTKKKSIPGTMTLYGVESILGKDSEVTERLTPETPASTGAVCDDQEFHVSKAGASSSARAEDAEVSKLLRENKDILDKIADLADFIDDDHVILLIGKIGAGKSSLINTIHKVLTERYFIIAPYGKGVTQSVTTELKRYNSCGVNEDLIERIPDKYKKQNIEKIFKKLPQIIDFAGLGNIDTPELTEILELLIGGFLPTRTTIQSLQQCQKEFGIGALKRLFPVSEPSFQVTKIVFLHGFTDDFPDKLILCLKGVLNYYQDSKIQLKCKPDLFILTTKFDLVRNQSLHSPSSSDESDESLQTFENVEKRLSEELNISGMSFRWINFHDGLKTDGEYVENLALKFLKHILQPGIPYMSQPKDRGFLQNAELKAFRIIRKLQQFLTQDVQLRVTRAIFLAVLLGLIAIILAIWLMK